ncbi:hypothetical protein BTUL_0303g00020 [Botrytis tulipae]|uniref:Carrier domain-containing protein n=1 Tax=Botrytis tulipae TaxID=87230 RepID=A0A4Z1E7Q2_9HELO|nr:hypothetical protein BTUL_0303g00020 [Botrytis tulipae]
MLCKSIDKVARMLPRLSPVVPRTAVEEYPLTKAMNIRHIEEYVERNGLKLSTVLSSAWIVTLYHMHGTANPALELADQLGPECGAFWIESVISQKATLLNILEAVQSRTTHLKDSSAREVPDAPSEGMHSRMLLTKKSMSAEAGAEMSSDSNSQINVTLGQESATIYISTKEQSDALTYWSIFKHVLDQIVQDPHVSISDLDVTSEWQLNRSVDEPPQLEDRCIHEVVFESCEKFPSNQAISAWDGSLTYSDLQQVTKGWSQVLHALKCPERSTFIISLQPSRWSIVGWLAIVAAGHICVPLDPDAPESRIQTILEQTQAIGVLCETTGVKTFEPMFKHVLTPKMMSKTPTPTKEADIETRNVPVHQPAVIMYTSGSTGTPKGVIQSHAALGRSIRVVSKKLELNEQTKFLQFASSSFDASICEIFTPLVAGGCVCIPSADKKLSELTENINAFQITHATLTATVASLLVPEEVPSLQNLYLGGEPATSDLCDKWQDRSSILYGTTETAVWDSLSMYSAEKSPKNIGVGIGGHLWVVHPADSGHLSPIGVPGELCVQNRDIAVGYLGMHKLTQEKFKDTPTWMKSTPVSIPSSQGRVYMTGDLARVLEDGTVEIIGRLDRQIKLNGQRLEPSEVEHQLARRLPSNLQVNVDILDESHPPQLAAFISHHPDGSPELMESPHQEKISNALDELSTVLPKYMVPSVIVSLVARPLTRTGKVDRRRLKEIGAKHVQSKRNKVPTGEKLEISGDLASSLSNTMYDVLSRKFDLDAEMHGHDVVFADVGLDSIGAMTMAKSLESKLNISVPSSHFLQNNARMSDIVEFCSAARPEHESDSSISLNEECAEWKSKLDTCARKLGRILVTGATGFLGSEILKQCFEKHETATVTVLVRAETETEARKRIRSLGGRIGWWKPDYEDRLQILLGDLSHTRLGLSEELWATLFGLNSEPRVADLIIHNGACVNWMVDYKTLRKANVESLFEMLTGMSSSSNPPRLLFISGGYISPDDESEAALVDKLTKSSGYDQTKFVCETMINHFNSQNPYHPVHIIKPGFIIGSIKHGVPQLGDAIWRLIKTCIRLGYYSDKDAQLWIPVAGVDMIATIILDAAFESKHIGEKGRFLKVLEGISFEQIWDVVRNLGMDVQPLDHEEWRRLVLEDIAKRNERHPMFPLADWFRETNGQLGGPVPRDHQFLSGLDFEVLATVKRNLQYLKEVDFFDI